MNTELLQSQTENKLSYLGKVSTYMAELRKLDYINPRFVEDLEKNEELLLRLPHHFTTNDLKRKLSIQEHLKYLTQLLKSGDINNRKLENFGLKDKDITKTIKTLELALSSDNLLHETFRIINKLQKFIESIPNYYRKAIELDNNFCETPEKLNAFYKENQINPKTFEYHSLLVIYLITYLRIQFDHASRLDLIVAAYSYYFEMKIYLTLIDESMLEPIFKIIGDFADFFNLSDVKLCDIEKVRFQLVEDFKGQLAVENELLWFNSPFERVY